MKIVVLGEGSSELGPDWDKRDPLRPIPDRLMGALEILVRRVANEVYRCDAELIALPRLQSHRPGVKDEIALVEAIQDVNYLERLLLALQTGAAEAAVVACDKNLAGQVANALKKVRPRLSGPVAHVVFDPEFEILFFDKSAVEKARALSACTLGPPPAEEALQKLGKAKKPLEKWLGGHCSPGARFFKQVATMLSVPGRRPSLTKLCGDIGCVFGHKKRPPAGDQIS